MRHRFYWCHRRAALWLLAAVIAADLVVIVVALRPDVFRNGLLTCHGVALYLVLYQSATARPPKELLVLFTAGTLLVAWTPGRLTRRTTHGGG